MNAEGKALETAAINAMHRVVLNNPAGHTWSQIAEAGARAMLAALRATGDGAGLWEAAQSTLNGLEYILESLKQALAAAPTPAPLQRRVTELEITLQQIVEWLDQGPPDKPGCTCNDCRMIRLARSTLLSLHHPPQEPALRDDAIRLRNCLRSLTDGTGDGDAALKAEGREAVMATRYLDGQEPAAQGREQLYDELLNEVQTKYEGETRHKTARRYIRERENRIYIDSASGEGEKT